MEFNESVLTLSIIIGIFASIVTAIWKHTGLSPLKYLSISLWIIDLFGIVVLLINIF